MLGTLILAVLVRSSQTSKSRFASRSIALLATCQLMLLACLEKEKLENCTSKGRMCSVGTMGTPMLRTTVFLLMVGSVREMWDLSMSAEIFSSRIV